MPTPIRDDEAMRSEQIRYFEWTRHSVPAAIEAGLESAPIGVVTTPGIQNPKYVSDEGWKNRRWSTRFLKPLKENA